MSPLRPGGRRWAPSRGRPRRRAGRRPEISGRNARLPQIVGPDGATYTVLLVPRRPSIFGALSLPGISLMILCIALVVSAFASWWLARASERAHPPHPGGRARARRRESRSCA